MLRLFGVFFFGLALTAPAVPAEPLHVLATTTLLASLAADVGHGRATVTSLMPVGASPETYQPTPADIVRAHDAGLIVENGAGLEAWLAPTLRATASHTPVVDCSAGLTVVDANPHLWLDPQNAQHYVAAMRDGMIAADPAGAAIYRANAAALDARLAALSTRIATAIATIPAANRDMIVFHNAWLYFNRRFGLQTLGTIEEVPGSEPSAAHIALLIDLARAAHVRAIFAEPEYNAKLVYAVARSAGIPHVAVLYDDSVGTSPQTRDYISMLDTDTATIVNALK
ncbi:MAG TPA: metal ABC transporter substrate-binding protein [Candidatus Lustribacter sp.]|nr:metal ABC transporter substrate-binding protein [Candidatus Lustribacter sp.]